MGSFTLSPMHVFYLHFFLLGRSGILGVTQSPVWMGPVARQAGVKIGAPSDGCENAPKSYPLRSASRRINAHKSSTCSLSVGAAPTDTRTIQRPSSIAGV